MSRTIPRRAVAALVVLAVGVGAALPALGSAAEEHARALIGTAQLKNGAVTNAKVKAGSLRYAAFAKRQVAPWSLKGIPAGGVLTGAYPAPGLAAGSVRAAQIATGAVGRSEIAAGAVGSEELAQGAVRAIDIANGSIGATKIAPNSIGKGQIAPGGVGASEIARGAVGPGELAALPGARVYLAEGTRIDLASGTRTTLSFGARAYSQGGVWSDAQPDRLTAPVAGVYQVTAGVVFEDNGSGARGVWIVDAGSGAVLAGERIGAVTTNGATAVNASAVVHLSAGQAVMAQAEQTAGREVDVIGTGQQTALGLQFLSP
ncbi:MAG: hypothetical protein ACKOD0_00575 [Actinomycetota bacterium]